MRYLTNSNLETQELAKKLAPQFKNGAVLALIGPLGSGKTTFTQGLAQGLGIKKQLISPTFILMRQYQIPRNHLGELYHIDLYRLEQLTEIESLGLAEILANPDNLVLIEWADRITNQLPQRTTKIYFKNLGDNQREIIIETADAA